MSTLITESGCAEHFHALQVLGNHGEVLGAITYSVTTHCPVPSAHQAAQRVQPQSQAQPESQQHDFSLPAAVTEADSTDSSISSVAPVQTASFGGQSQPGSHAAADAVSDAAASQDSTALTAFGTHRRTASKHDERAPLAHVQQGTKAVSSSLDKDLDADSLISSSSGVLFGTVSQHLDVCRCTSGTAILHLCVVLPSENTQKQSLGSANRLFSIFDTSPDQLVTAVPVAA